jgi:hypothetical protein
MMTINTIVCMQSAQVLQTIKNALGSIIEVGRHDHGEARDGTASPLNVQHTVVTPAHMIIEVSFQTDSCLDYVCVCVVIPVFFRIGSFTLFVRLMFTAFFCLVATP